VSARDGDRVLETSAHPFETLEPASLGSAGSGSFALAEERALLATLRHDLRTPLNAILGFGEMLLEDDAEISPSARSLAPGLQRVVGSGTELLRQVNEILDPARIVAGIIELGSARTFLQLHLREPIIAIIAYTDELLDEATSAGREDARPDIEKVREAARRFLTLVDEARSIPTNKEGSARPDGDGKPDNTSTAALVREATSSIHAMDRGRRSIGTERGAILVVDDNEFNREVLRQHLGRIGHVVTTAENGRDALEVVKAAAFDLILLDILMPDINGYDALIRLKADEATRDIPVIVISALDDMDAVVSCIEVGAEDYLPKPFNPTLLNARIGACLEKKRLRDHEKEYLRHVAELTDAAASVEAGAFDPRSLALAAERTDALGQLVRVFQRMATEVHQREQRLQAEVHQLHIEIDATKLASEVTSITKSDFFVDLERKAEVLRMRRHSGD